MAIYYKILGQATVGYQNQTVYIVPEEKQAIISCMLFHAGDGPGTTAVYAVKSGDMASSSVNIIYRVVNLTEFQTFQFTDKITLGPGDEIVVSSTSYGDGAPMPVMTVFGTEMDGGVASGGGGSS
jgi:hypothetical protein